MAQPIIVPRINNNDDQVKLTELRVALGQAIEPGQIVAVIETDKASVDIEAPAAGFVIALAGAVGDAVDVGSALVWVGDDANEAPPQTPTREVSADAAGGAPTAKAQALLREYGIDAGSVAASGARLSAEDVRRYIAARGLRPAAATSRASSMSGSIAPSEPGERRPLTSHERGMVNTVVWQRDHAVPGYVEIGYDHAVWDRHAKAVAQSRGLLVSPLLAMMCWRLARLASEQPRYNATVVDDARFEYASVNLGFTVQAADRLYLAVLRDAARHDEAGFIEAMTDMQRRAAAHALEPAELAGATIAFSSMSRWNVSRHVPILAPHTALMVAHTVDARGAGKLGATYDHRVLHGGDVATLLRKVAAAPTTTTE